MDVNDVRQRKAALENQVASLIAAFESETGMVVRDLVLHGIYDVREIRKHVFVQAKVELTDG